MKSNVLFKIFLLVLFYHTVVANEIQSVTEEIIKSQLGDDIEISFEKYYIPAELRSSIENQCEQSFFDDNIYLWLIKSEDSIVSFALMDNVYGKSLPITFLVIFNNDGSIQSSHIIKYREDHGGAVSSERWNQQFSGRNEDSSFIIGEDIHGISGATISVRSVTLGIQKLTLLYKEIIKNYENRTLSIR